MAAQRRQRYAVTYIDGKTGETNIATVLGYSADYPRRVVEHNGHRYVSSRPLRKGEAATLANDYSAKGFKLNHLNLRQAERELGLKWPVKYVLITRKSATDRGCCNSRLDAHGRPYHEIEVRAHVKPEHAGRTLWHELRHARQIEDMCDRRAILPGCRAFNIARMEEYRGISEREWRNGRTRGSRYLTRNWEREARATEANNDRLALAR